MQRFHISFLLGILLLLLSAGAGQAQDNGPQATPRATPVPEDTSSAADAPTQANQGSIRGVVYQDSDNDGICPEEFDAAVIGVPIRFVSNDGQTTVFLESGADGSYGLAAAGYGTWQVTAEPSTAQGVVTSAKTREVFISEDEPVALGVNFCVSTGGGSGTNPVVLPESGAAATVDRMPIVALLTALGLTFIVAGLLQYQRERYTRS